MMSAAATTPLTLTKTQLWSHKAKTALSEIKAELPERDVDDLLKLSAYSHKRSAIPGYGTQTVSYTTSNAAAFGKAGYGRLYSTGRCRSIETLSRKLRGSLVESIYHDLDIKNCQPTILSQLARRYGFTLTTLDIYAAHRDAFLDEIVKSSSGTMTHDEAKESVIAHIFGGMPEHPWIASVGAELIPLVNHLKGSSEWTHLYSLINEKIKNRNGKFLAALLATEERKCMVAMNNYLESIGWSVDVLAYDGVMIRKRPDHSITPELLTNLQTAVKEATGYEICVVEKPMSSYFPEPVPTHVETVGITVPDGTAITDLLAAQKMIELLGDDIKKQGTQIYIYNPITGMWDSDKDALFRAALLLGNRLTITNGKDTCHYGSMVRKTDAMIRCVPDLVPATNWILDNTATSKGKILFNNGIYDMMTQTFTPGFNKSIVFTARAGRDLGERDEDVITVVKETVFKNPYKNPDVGYYYARVLARAIAGHTEDKMFPVVLGEPNTGKSTATTLMGNTFGGFVSVWNIDNLKFKAGSTTDEAKRFSWIASCINSRLAISNEARMDGVKLDGNLAKRLSGGGDDITFRQNFRDESTVRLMTTFMAMANDMPDFSPIDPALRVRMKYIASDFTFVPKLLEDCVGLEKPGDPLLKDKVASAAWQDAFAYSIFDAYGDGSVPVPPAEVIETTDDYIPPPSVGLEAKLEEAGYIITTSETDYIPSRDIIAKMRATGIALSDCKIGRELTKMGLKRTEKRVAGKQTKVWLCVKEL